MRRPGIAVIICVVLAGIVVVGAAVQGAARFTGLRWVIRWDFSAPTFTPPPFSAQPSATPAPASEGGTRGASLDWGLIVGIAIVLAVLIAVFFLIRWLLGRRRVPMPTIDADIAVISEEPKAPEQAEPNAPVLQRGFQQAIAVLDEVREPGDAIVAAWLGLQEAAEDSGIRRRPAEAPSEFTTRILSRVPADRAAVDTILRLYLGVRFGDHPATPGDVRAVRDALSQLAESWEAVAARAAAPTPPWQGFRA
jgi:prepilin signal peptidase PulO-like enzyme (type II secretory pathway)